jgi:hypothetical protein
MRVFFIFILFSFFGASADQMENAYKEGQNFSRENRNVDMDEALRTLKSDEMDFLQADKDVSSFTNDSIYSRPADKELYDFVTESEKQKNAMQDQEKFDSGSNALIVHSESILANPLAHTGQKHSENTGTSIKETIETCLEGANFKIDMFAQLTFIPPPLKTFYREEKKKISLSCAGQLPHVEACFENHSPGSFCCAKPENHSYKIDLNWVKDYCNRNSLTPNCEYIVDYKVTKIYRTFGGYHDYYGLRGWWGGKLGAFEVVNRTPYEKRNGDGEKYWVRAGVDDRYIYYGFLRAFEVVNRTPYEKRDGDGEEYWSILNEEAEKTIEENSCFEVGKDCLDSGEKTIDGFKVHRDCWKWKRTYQCSGLPENGCKYLEDKGCLLEKSECTKRVGGLCMQYKRTFVCKSKQSVSSKTFSGGDVFCANGDCFVPEVSENGDMKEAVSKLAVFNEMQKQIKTDPLRVFGGDSLSCSNYIADFNNCCRSMKGWGKDIGLASCSEGEEALAKRRGQGLCHYVGSYCAEKFLGQCIQKKQTFCCFDSKLSRIFQEQGRNQLGKGWGSGRGPSCEGLTVEQLQDLNFDSMDLSEFYEEIQTKAAIGMEKAIKIKPNVKFEKSTRKADEEVQEERIKKLKEKNKLNMENGDVVEKTY